MRLPAKILPCGSYRCLDVSGGISDIPSLSSGRKPTKHVSLSQSGMRGEVAHAITVQFLTAMRILPRRCTKKISISHISLWPCQRTRGECLGTELAMCGVVRRDSFKAKDRRKLQYMNLKLLAFVRVIARPFFRCAATALSGRSRAAAAVWGCGMRHDPRAGSRAT